MEHQQQCPVSPRSEPRYQGYLWHEVAGTPCNPWSAIGGRQKWLHPSAKPTLVWAYSTSFYEVDAATMENKKEQDSAQIEKAFSQHAEQTISPTARPLRVGEGLNQHFSK